MKRLLLSVLSGLGVALVLFTILQPDVLMGVYFSLRAAKAVMLYLPEHVLYLFLVVIAAWVLLAGLYRDIVAERYKPKIRSRKLGPIESLSLEITKMQRKNYFHWVVQNRLAKIAQKIIAFQGNETTITKTKLSGARWHPPPYVNTYLENGLRSQHEDNPRNWYSRILDYRLSVDEHPKITEVIDFLIVAENEI